jgi:hypothetical protein
VDKSSTRENVSKIYCEKCDKIFNSREKYDAHSSEHSSVISCESCPLDIVLGKIIGLFKRAK